MKYIKTYEALQSWNFNNKEHPYKFYWIVPFDDRLAESINEIVKKVDDGSYGNERKFNVAPEVIAKSLIEMIESWKKNMICGILTYNFVIDAWDISRYNQKEIDDCEFKNYEFRGIINIDEEDLKMYQEIEKYNL